MFPNWFPQSEVTRNQGSIFYFISQRLYMAGKWEAYWMDLCWCSGMLWCHSKQPWCRFSCPCSHRMQINLLNARPILLHTWFVPFYKNEFKRKSKKLWHEGGSTSWEWHLALPKHSHLLWAKPSAEGQAPDGPSAKTTLLFSLKPAASLTYLF